ncbi:hypothetical protein PMIN06_005590 [Paraphaeosphaeria minitans]
MEKMRPEDANIVVDSTYSRYREDDDDDSQSYISGQSLASSVTRYRYENGRRYHAYRDGSYYAPNDDTYSHYETIVHHLWLLTLDDRLYLAPIASPTRILDVGTGTGLWAIDMADAHPAAQILATDLSPMQSTSAPPNIRFEIDDAASEWTYAPEAFDYIHVRGLTGCIRDWPLLYAQAHAHLEPGGYFEHAEFSVTTNADPDGTSLADRMYSTFSSTILSIGEEKTGQRFDAISHMGTWMRAAGFVDVVEQHFVWPIGPWPKDPKLKELGRWGERNWADGLEGWVMALYTRILGWKYEQVVEFVRAFRKVIKDRKNHYCQDVRVVYGRKPRVGEVVEPAAAAADKGEDAA